MDDFLADLDEDENEQKQQDEKAGEGDDYIDTHDNLTIPILKDDSFLQHLRNIDLCLNDKILEAFNNLDPANAQS